MINRPAGESFADSCRGFAAMIRSGALQPDDHEMMAKKFEAAADLIDALTKKIWREVMAPSAKPIRASDPR